MLLAQSGIPAIVLECDELRAIFAHDVALFGALPSLADNIARMVADPAARRHYGELVAADARRRFSPRRSAIRVVDLSVRRFALGAGWNAPYVAGVMFGGRRRASGL